MTKRRAGSQGILLADARNRALSQLSTYIMARLNMPLNTLWEEAGQGKDCPYERLRKFLSGQENLEDAEFAALMQTLVRLFAGKVDVKLRMAEAHWLLPLIDVIDPDSHAMFEVDQKQGDASFLRALQLEHLLQQPALGREIHRLVGGFWYVIRYSTLENPPQPGLIYNVSLLSVHDLAYVNNVARDPVHVRTIIPHFTLRSAATHREPSRVHLGRVIKLNDEISFLGTREDKKKLIRMTWREPIRQLRDENDPDGPHIKEGRGMITTTSSSGATITGPVAACEVPHTEAITELKERLRDGEGDSTALADLFLARRKELETHVGAKSEKDMIRSLRDFTGKTSILDAISHLVLSYTGVREDVKGGNYFVPIQG